MKNCTPARYGELRRARRVAWEAANGPIPIRVLARLGVRGTDLSVYRIRDGKVWNHLPKFTPVPVEFAL